MWAAGLSLGQLPRIECLRQDQIAPGRPDRPLGEGVGIRIVAFGKLGAGQLDVAVVEQGPEIAALGLDLLCGLKARATIAKNQGAQANNG